LETSQPSSLEGGTIKLGRNHCMELAVAEARAQNPLAVNGPNHPPVRSKKDDEPEWEGASELAAVEPNGELQ
jgi:hypothetical protein